MAERDELYTVARTVLLDALEALGEHRKALVLVGAQAIYLRVGEADLAVASYTTDGDLAIDPRILVEVPPLEQKLTEAGFKRNAKGDIGIWVTRRPTASQPAAAGCLGGPPGSHRLQPRRPSGETQVCRPSWPQQGRPDCERT